MKKFEQTFFERIDDIMDDVEGLEANNYCGGYRIQRKDYVAGKDKRVLFSTEQISPFRRKSYYVYDVTLNLIASAGEDDAVYKNVWEFFFGEVAADAK